ncbi:MAG: methyl-accepting chemotaxis protein [Candidatus Dormiibacterota bacterium]
MQLRRGPPPIRVLDDQPPTVRVARGYPAAELPPRTRRWSSWDSYFFRVVAGSVAVTIPIAVILGFVMSNWSTQTITDQANARTQVAATSSAVRIADWVKDRKAEMRTLAHDYVGRVDKPGLAADLMAAGPFHPDFKTIEIVAPSGAVLATTRVGSDISPFGSDGTFANSLTTESMGPIEQTKAGLQWVMTAPIAFLNARSEGVVVGELYPGILGRLLNPNGSDVPSAGSQEVHVANGQGYVLYSSDWGVLSDGTAIIAKGALSSKVNPAIIGLALANGAGSAQVIDFRGHHVLAGYQTIPVLGWIIIASTETATALAPVYEQQFRTSVIQLVGAILFIGFAIVLARLSTRPIVALSHAARSVELGDLSVRVHLKGSGEVRGLSATFNSMLERLGSVLGRLRGEATESAAKLSAAAEQLASATLEQTRAVNATSSNMEALSRSTVSMADIMNRVATQSADARSSLELAQSGLKASGDRTLVLAGRVNEVEGVLELINDIADQTSLLALNAAIEAARAGDAGRGFAVVADEVRRLAERSKGAAAEIAKLVEGAQAQSGETVMALQTSVQQMERGVALMQSVTEAGGLMQAAHQNQRSSTEEVLRAIEAIAEGSRNVSVTAQEIAAASARQGALAAELASSG